MVNRRLMLIGIKSLHTLIFLVMSAAIVYVLYAGVVRRYDGWLLLALGAVILECVVYLANNRRCPLTKWARQYGDATGNDWLADLFVPAWFAPKIPLVCGGLFVVSVIVLILNFVLMVR